MTRWTEEELNIVREHLWEEDMSALTKKLPERSYDSIEKKRRLIRANNHSSGHGSINLSIIDGTKVTHDTKFARLNTGGQALEVTLNYDGVQVLRNDEKTNDKGDEHGILIASDFHIGHRYNDGSSTLEDRKRGLKNASKNLMHVIRNHNRVKNLTVAVLGDIMQGMENYEHQACESDPEGKQIKNAVEALCDFLTPIIDTCYSEGINVDIVEVTGSHGKPSRKWDKAIDNHDATIYWMANKLLIMKYPELEDKILSDTQTIIREYSGLVVAFEHGDACYSIKNVPFYGLNNRVKDISFMHRRMIDCLATGHFHCWGRFNIGGCNVITSGTLQTESNLGFQLGRSAVTSFHFFCINDNKLTSSWPIFTE